MHINMYLPICRISGMEQRHSTKASRAFSRPLPIAPLVSTTVTSRLPTSWMHSASASARTSRQVSADTVYMLCSSHRWTCGHLTVKGSQDHT